jgi:NAD(P)-dependent dehydrogenase (short-subunit alcohol dehydrogenase family)
MRVLIVGASGTIGRAVVAELGKRHEIISAGRSSGDVRMDITDSKSIRAVFEKVGTLDALVSTTGKVKFAPFANMEAADYEIGLKDKLLGQVNLVLIGRHYLSDGGSFTLTTGCSTAILREDVGLHGQWAINAFVMAAAIEMPGIMRINAVSPESQPKP